MWLSPESLRVPTAKVASRIASSLLNNRERELLQSVPEPSTYALFGIGAIGMLMVMRRKRAA